MEIMSPDDSARATRLAMFAAQEGLHDYSGRTQGETKERSPATIAVTYVGAAA